MKLNLKVCIVLLSCYVMTWVLIFMIPMLEFEAQKNDLYLSYLLFAEEVFLLICIIVVGMEFAKDMKKKLIEKTNNS